MRIISRIFAVFLIVWVASIGLYAWKINSYEQKISRAPEAIVVLTGGSHRIQEGIDLMSLYGCANMFISGVNRDVSRHDILGLVQNNIDTHGCDLELGYTARNTHENAQEVLAWMKKKAYKSMVLVTAHYHMPRSLLEFQAIAPDIAIDPYPVYPDLPKSSFAESIPIRLWLLVKEYHKYIAAWARIHMFQW